MWGRFITGVNATTTHVVGISLTALSWRLIENYGRMYCTIVHRDIHYHRGQAVPREILQKYEKQGQNVINQQHPHQLPKTPPLRVITFPVRTFFMDFPQVPSDELVEHQP